MAKISLKESTKKISIDIEIKKKELVKGSPYPLNANINCSNQTTMGGTLKRGKKLVGINRLGAGASMTR